MVELDELLTEHTGRKATTSSSGRASSPLSSTITKLSNSSNFIAKLKAKLQWVNVFCGPLEIAAVFPPLQGYTPSKPNGNRIVGTGNRSGARNTGLSASDQAVDSKKGSYENNGLNDDAVSEPASPSTSASDDAEDQEAIERQKQTLCIAEARVADANKQAALAVKVKDTRHTLIARSA